MIMSDIRKKFKKQMTENIKDSLAINSNKIEEHPYG